MVTAWEGAPLQFVIRLIHTYKHIFFNVPVTPGASVGVMYRYNAVDCAARPLFHITLHILQLIWLPARERCHVNNTFGKQSLKKCCVWAGFFACAYTRTPTTARVQSKQLQAAEAWGSVDTRGPSGLRAAWSYFLPAFTWECEAAVTGSMSVCVYVCVCVGAYREA